jgi:hypothetical protein
MEKSTFLANVENPGGGREHNGYVLDMENNPNGML